jgi:hypothetical protein
MIVYERESKVKQRGAYFESLNLRGESEPRMDGMDADKSSKSTNNTNIHKSKLSLQYPSFVRGLETNTNEGLP